MTKEEAREAFMAGFDESGEGFNGEWPFRDGRAKPHDHASLEEAFEKFWKEYRK